MNHGTKISTMALLGLKFCINIYGFALMSSFSKSFIAFIALQDTAFYNNRSASAEQIPCNVLWKTVQLLNVNDIVIFSASDQLSPCSCIANNSHLSIDTDNANSNNALETLMENFIAILSCTSLPTYPFLKSSSLMHKMSNQTNSSSTVISSGDKILLLIMYCNQTEMKVLTSSKREMLANYKLLIFFNSSSVMTQFAEGQISSSFSIDSHVLCVFYRRKDKILEIHELYKLGHDGKVRMHISKVLTILSDLMPKWAIISQLFSEKSRANISNIGFRVSGVISLEYSYDTNIVKDANGSYLFQDSFSVQVLQALQYTMNFRIEPKVTMQWGYLDETNNWTGMISMLINNEADLGISSLADRPFRREVVDFNIPTSELHLSAFFRSPSKVTQSNALVEPFHMNFWIALFLWCFSLSISIIFLNKMQRRYQMTERDAKYIWESVDCLQWPLNAICLKADNNCPPILCFRIVIATGALVGVIIYSAYAGTLFSFLSVTAESIKNLELLLTHDYKISIVNSPLPLQFLSESPNKNAREVFRRRTMEPKYSSMGEASSEVAKGSFIFICDHLSGYVSLNKDFNLQDACSVNEIIIPDGVQKQGTIVQKGSPYKRLIDYQIIRMKEYGLVNYWNMKYINSKPKCSSGVTYEGVHVESVMLAYAVFIFGIVISSLFFLSELMLNRFKLQYTFEY